MNADRTARLACSRMPELALWCIIFALTIACARPPGAPTGWVDRIEGDTAVLLIEDDDGQWLQRDVPLTSLPASVREGDRVVVGRLDPAGRRRQAARIRELQRVLFGRPGGATDDPAASPRAPP